MLQKVKIQYEQWYDGSWDNYIGWMYSMYIKLHVH